MSNNPARYRRMCEPHESLDAANAAVQKFWEAVEKAREEYRIADVTVLAEVVYGEDEARAQADLHLGSSLQRLPMIARAYGQVREAYDQMVTRIVEGARKEERGR